MSVNFCHNASKDFVTDEHWSLVGVGAVNGIVTGINFLAFILVGIPLNILVVITVCKEKLYMQPAIILLLNLVFTDIVILIFPTTVIMITGLAGEFLFGSSDAERCEFCHLTWFIIFSCLNSFLIVALMSVDRLVYIGKPLQYERLVTPCVMWTIVLIVFMANVAIGMGALSGHLRSFVPQLLICVRGFSTTYASICISVGFLTLMVVIVSNIWFLVIVLRNINSVYGNESNTKFTLHNCFKLMTTDKFYRK